MLNKNRGQWFEAWGYESAQNQFLKFLLLIFFLIIFGLSICVGVLVTSGTKVIALTENQTLSLGETRPSPEQIQLEVKRAIVNYIKVRHNWTPASIDQNTIAATNFIDERERKKFFMSVKEQIREAKEKKITQKFYPSQVDCKADNKAIVTGDRILIVDGFRVSQEMSFELTYEKEKRTNENREGVYITNEVLLKKGD